MTWYEDMTDVASYSPSYDTNEALFTAPEDRAISHFRFRDEEEDKSEALQAFNIGSFAIYTATVSGITGLGATKLATGLTSQNYVDIAVGGGMTLFGSKQLYRAIPSLQSIYDEITEDEL